MTTISTGAKRPNPYGNELPPAQKPKSAYDVYAELVGHFTNTTVLHCANVAWFIETLSKDDAYDSLESGMNLTDSSFCSLMEHSQFDALAKAFLRYCDVMTEGAMRAGKSFKSWLSFKFPPDWTSADPAAMERAFSSIRVSKLTVLACTGNMFADDGLIPADVCSCIVNLLMHGTKELEIHGALAEPEWVVEAFGNSCLRSVVLEADYSFDGLNVLGLPSYNTLLAGLGACKSLEHLTFGHTLAGAHGILLELQRFRASPLKALTLTLRDDTGREDVDVDVDVERDMVMDVDVVEGHIGIKELMKAVNQLSELSVLRVTIETLQVVMRETDFLDPLHGHPKLSELSIERETETGLAFQPNIHFLPNVVLFAQSCTELRRFLWDTGLSVNDVLQEVAAFIAAGGALKGSARAASMAQALRDKGIKLQKLAVQGEVLSSDALEHLMHALADNQSLVDLNLINSMLDAKSASALMKSLETNWTLDKARFPECPDHYFTLDDAGRAHGFEATKDNRFVLKITRAAPGENEEAVAAVARSSFDPSAEQVNAFLTRLPAQLVQNRMAVGFPQLKPSMKSVLASAARELVTGALVGPDSFDYVADQVLQHLQENHGLAAAVHMRQVNQAALVQYRAHMQSEGLTHAPRLLRTLVLHSNKESDALKLAADTATSDRIHADLVQRHPGYGKFSRQSREQRDWHKQAVAAVQADDVEKLLDLIDEGLTVNTVADDGSNILLMHTTRSGNTNIWRILLAEQAFDFGGMAAVLGAQYKRIDEFVAQVCPGYGYAIHLGEAASALYAKALKAIRNDDADKLVDAIEGGVSLNAMDGVRANGLMRMAAAYGRFDMLRVLEACGALDFDYLVRQSMDADFVIPDDGRLLRLDPNTASSVAVGSDGPAVAATTAVETAAKDPLSAPR